MKRGVLARGRAALYRFGPTRSLIRRVRPRALVLIYHRVAEVSIDPFRLAVLPATFERHLRLLRRRYSVISLPELVERLDGGCYPDESVAVTFDDGYEDNSRLAYPIAAQNGIPIAVFVTVAPLLVPELYWWDELGARMTCAETRTLLHGELKALPAALRRARLDELETARPEALAELGRALTCTELQEFARQPGVTIGAHSMTHPSLGRVPAEQQVCELRASRESLEELLGMPVTLAAYPFGQPGDVSDTTRRAARDAGYHAVFASTHGVVTPGKPREALPRMTVYEWSDDELLRRTERLFRAS